MKDDTELLFKQSRGMEKNKMKGLMKVIYEVFNNFYTN